MTKYREILRLHSLGFSQQNIAYSSNVSKKTVNRVINRAKQINISWPLDDSHTDAVLEKILFPKSQANTVKRMPDFAYVCKELLKNGVNRKLL
jgi:IS30 family transposase